MKISGLQAVEQALALNLADISPPESGRVLAAAHLEAHDQVVGDAGRRSVAEPDFVEVVDGHVGAPLASAEVQIVTLYDYRLEAALWAIERLEANSPVVSGLYRRSHTLFVNGTPAGAVRRLVSASAEVMVTNLVPYARRLEVGVTESGRSFVAQVPPGIYERTMREVRRRYGQVLDVYFGYVDLSNSYVLRGGGTISQRYRTSKKGGDYMRKRHRAVGEAVRAPALRFYAL